MDPSKIWARRFLVSPAAVLVKPIRYSIILRGREGAIAQNSGRNTGARWLISRMTTLRVDCFRSTPHRHLSLFRGPTQLAPRWRITSLGMVLQKRRLETPREMFATMASAFSPWTIYEFGPTSR